MNRKLRDVLERVTDPRLRTAADVHLLKTLVDADKVNNREMGLAQFVEKHGHAPFDHEVHSFEVFDENRARADFESMAAVCYPGALSAGRDETWGTYINSNLEKRWKGWKACDEFRAGIIPTQQRGKS